MSEPTTTPEVPEAEPAAPQITGPAIVLVRPVETEPEAVIVTYQGGIRHGEEYGLPSVEAAMRYHPDATITAYRDGRPFEVREAEASVREVRGLLRAEARAEREAAAEAEAPTPRRRTAPAEPPATPRE